MTLLALSRGAALAAAIIFTALPAQAEECDAILAALSKKADTLTKMDAKGAKLCAGMGQLVPDRLFWAREEEREDEKAS